MMPPRCLTALSAFLAIGSCLLGPGAALAAEAAAKPAESPAKPAAATTAKPAASPAKPAEAAAKPAESKPLFKPEELDQLVAPIALYPDDLISQILMASTYPLEIVQAARAVKGNPNIKGDWVTKALEGKDWDPSVKSLVNFPDVLYMMDEKLDWTQKLGDAVLAQQKDVMDAIQRLRAKANETGNLKTTEQQKVIVEEKVIQIVPANPDVVYVPTYNPTVVYGTWPYPAYPPYYYYPPGYVAGTAAFSFAAGVAVGAAWGYAWGHCDWGHGDVDVDVDRNVNRNSNINRENYRNQANANRTGTAAQSGGKGTWQHDPSHRKGTPYRDQSTAQRYNKGATTADAKSREAFRGYSDAGRQSLQKSAGGSPGQTPRASTQTPRASTQQPQRTTQTASRPAAQSSRSSSSAFQDYSSGREVKAQSSRGQTSRQSSPSVQRSGGTQRASPSVRSGGGGRGGGGRR